MNLILAVTDFNILKLSSLIKDEDGTKTKKKRKEAVNR
jgi:hypothetical protein